MSPSSARAQRPDPPRQEKRAGPLVWIVDADHWPRACLRAELIERGHEAVGWPDLTRPLTLLARPRASQPGAVVIALRGLRLGPGALETLRNLRVPLVAVAGAVEWNDPEVAGLPWAARLARPVSMGEIADVVERVVRR